MVRTSAVSEVLTRTRWGASAAISSAQAWVDYRRPSLRDGWGPLNGQRLRQEAVRQLISAVEVDRIVETGTFRGCTTQFLAHVSGKPVHTADCNRRFHGYARRRFVHQRDIQLVLGDSRQLLQTVAQSSDPATETVFFYLDAHFYTDLPTAQEVEIIARTWPRAVVMIDDFAVPDDPGYGYDDYGPGKRLELSYLPSDVLDRWSIFFPSAASPAETGHRRGCVVLTSPDLGPALNGVTTLRRYP